MSSPPEDRSLEGLVADNWDDAVVSVVLSLLEPYREPVEHIANEYDESTQSWRDYRRAVWSPVPDSVFDEIEVLLNSLCAEVDSYAYRQR